jgi:hypothetical protein
VWTGGDADSDDRDTARPPIDAAAFADEFADEYEG